MSAATHPAHSPRMQKSLPVRPPPPQRRPAKAIAEADLRSPQTADAAQDHGRGVSAVRPPLQDPDGLEEAQEVAKAGAAVREVGQEPGQVEEPESRKGVGVPG